MKRIETQFVEFGDKKIPFRFSINSFIYYTEEYNKEITELKSMIDAINFFYCAYKAGCDYSKSPKMTYEEFVNMMDDYPEAVGIISALMAEAMGTKKK